MLCCFTMNEMLNITCIGSYINVNTALKCCKALPALTVQAVLDVGVCVRLSDSSDVLRGSLFHLAASRRVAPTIKLTAGVYKC